MNVDTSLWLLIMERLISFGMWSLPHNDRRDRFTPCYWYSPPLFCILKEVECKRGTLLAHLLGDLKPFNEAGIETICKQLLERLTLR
jgi:hypothetical protein